MQKIITFVKQNLAAVLGIAAIVVTCLLMLLPGQFADLNTSSLELNKLNGYEFLFNTFVKNGKTYHFMSGGFVEGEGKVLPAAIAIIVLMVLAITSFAFSKKSSALLALGGLLDVVLSIFYFSMEVNAEKKYGLKYVLSTETKDVSIGVIQWVSYVAGALLVLAGAYAIYKAVMIMRDEIKHPQAQKGPTYNYLKK